MAGLFQKTLLLTPFQLDMRLQNELVLDALTAVWDSEAVVELLLHLGDVGMGHLLFFARASEY